VRLAFNAIPTHLGYKISSTADVQAAPLGPENARLLTLALMLASGFAARGLQIAWAQ
jgi:hypothetical protein